MADKNSPRRPDLTKVEGNPAADIHHLYDCLMKIDDPDLLHAKLVDLVDYRLQNGGISKLNAAKFRLNAERATARGLVSLQGFANNWLLSAMGMPVLGRRPSA